MDVLEAIFTRRSIRKYTQGRITEEQLMTIIKAGMSCSVGTQPTAMAFHRDKG